MFTNHILYRLLYQSNTNSLVKEAEGRHLSTSEYRIRYNSFASNSCSYNIVKVH